MKRTGRPPIAEDDDSVPVCVSLPGRQYDALYTRAQAAGVSVPEVIRRDLGQAAEGVTSHIETRPPRSHRQ